MFLFPVRRPSTTHSPTHSPTLPPTSAERRECAPSLEQRRDKVAKITSVHSRACARAHTRTRREAIFNSVFNTSHPKHRESPLLKKHGGETQLCSSPGAQAWSRLPAIVTVITAASQMAALANVGGRLRGARHPLRLPLTEEQFICQHLAALPRYLIPALAPGTRGLPWRHSPPHHFQIHQGGGSRRHLEGSGTSV